MYFYASLASSYTLENIDYFFQHLSVMPMFLAVAVDYFTLRHYQYVELLTH